MADWIKIHRSVLDSYSFADPVTFKIWVWMLLKANYKASFVPLNHGKGTVSIKVDRGQFIFGRNRAAEELKIAGSTIVRHMEKLQTEGQIIIEPNNQYSLITICKYNTYQNIKEKDEQVTDKYRTSNGQVTDSERTSNGHIKEELEDKEEKKYFINKPKPENFNGLPEIKIGSVIQLFKITKQTDISKQDVSGLWEVFKIQNLTGKKFYEDEDAVYSHFINWSKNQKIENGTDKPTVGTTKFNAGANQLLERLKGQTTPK